MSSILSLFSMVINSLKNVPLPLFSANFTLYDFLKDSFILWALVNIFMSKFFKSAVSSVYDTSQMKFDNDVKRAERNLRVKSKALNNYIKYE